MRKVRMEIIGMSYSQSQSGAYALVLGVPGKSKRLPIIIGGFEAQAIAIELEKMKPTRPLTHDLFKNFALHFGIRLKEILINKFEDGIFYSRLIFVTSDGEINEVDSRTSDAVALSLRFNCPIFADSKVIDEAGIVIDENDKPIDVEDEAENEPTQTVSPKDIKKYADSTTEELEDLLAKAIAEENFEEASIIRDELNHRK